MPIAPLSAKTLTDALHWRYATKKFDASRTLPPETWAALEEALVLAPSSMGIQPWKFIVVRDPATRERLSAAAHGQRQPVDCSHFVVFAGRKSLDATDVERFITRASEVRAVPKESLKGYADMMIGATERARKGGTLDDWMHRQVYIALGQFMTAAALLGVDTCPMEGIEPEKFDAILGLSAMGYTALCAAAAGYRSPEDKYAASPKVRFRAADVIVHV
ncbi:MAG TPA: NAD(P)H-dependent oxidoreductase [Opitutaceae bacterium]